MALAIPEIKDIFELLKPIIDENSTYISHKTKLLNAPGENYGSLMLSLDVLLKENGEDKTINTVVKLCPPNEWLRRMFATDITFQKEVKFYLELVPALYQFQLEYKKPEHEIMDIFPKCLGARLNLNKSLDIVDENAVLILENLKTKGYKTGDRMVGFDLEEAEYTLKYLAYFHAVPLAYRLHKPDEFMESVMPMLNKINIGQEMFDEVGHRFIESINLHLNLSSEKYSRFEKGMRKGYEFQKHFPSGNEKYATTVHRDFWITNTMLLKNSENQPINNKILDFQVITYGSPASDLVFFLYTSVKQSVIEQHYDYLIETYYKYFIKYLNNLNCDVKDYSLESFKNEMNIYGSLEASHIIIMFKAVFADKEAIKEITDFNIDEMFNDTGITNEYKQRLIWTVNHFFEKNWL